MAIRLRSLDESAAREFAGLCTAMLFEIFSRVPGALVADLEDRIRQAVFKMVITLATGEVQDIEQFVQALAAIADSQRPERRGLLKQPAKCVDRVLGPRERNVGGLKVEVGFWPFHRVGGDFYEMNKLRNGRALVALGDAVGKGPTACAISLCTLSALRAKVPSSDSAAELLRDLNSLMVPIRDGDSVSVSLLEWMPGEPMAQILNAGMPRPLHITASGVIEEVDVCGHPLGWFRNPAIGAATLDISKTARLLFWSDGIADSETLKQHVLDSVAATGKLPGTMGFATPDEDVEPDDRTAILIEFR